VFGEGGEALFFQGAKHPGKLFVAAFGLDREHTSWPVHQTFIPFLDLTLQAARAEDPTPTSYEPGETGLVQLPSPTTAREVVLRDEKGEVTRAPVEQGRAQLRMPDQPGLYNLTYDDHDKIEKVFAINPSPKESQLSYVEEPEALNSWRFSRPEDVVKGAVSPARAQLRLAGILQQRLWWWMVLGGLGALMLEMTLAEARKEQR
jgi:hypothetical protein